MVRGSRAALVELEEVLNTPIDHSEVLDLITRMAADLKARMRPGAALVGIHTGGVWVAEHLRRHVGLPDPLGELNIAFYRDDFSHIGMHPSVRPSTLPFDVDGRHIVLVDDVLYTGRTVRAALNEIFDYGRPASVMLVVLVDRSGREIPIQPDVTGTTMDLPAGQHVKLMGPDPLSLVVQRAA